MKQSNQNKVIEFKAYFQEINQFIADLPLANATKAAQLLYDKMQEIITIKATTEEKIQLLDLLCPTVERLYGSLKRQLLTITPLNAIQKAQETNWIIQLPLRFATIYASLISNNASESTKKQHQNNAYAIFSAMYYLMEALIASYDLYQSPPQKLWYRLHTLYSLAEKINLLNLPLNHSSQLENIDTLYKIGLLIAIASPYQLRRRDIEALYKTISKWAHNLEITTDLTNTQYVIELNSDRSPIFSILYQKDQQTVYTRGINTAKFIQSIQHIIKQHSDETTIQATALSKNVFDYIVRSWGGSYKRASKRQERKGTIKVCIGLSALHYYISGRRYFDSAELLSNEKINVAESTSIQQQNTTATSRQDASSEGSFNLSAIHGDNSMPKVNYPLYDFILHDESEDGLCIITKEQNISMLQNGQIIGLHYSQDTQNNAWQIGIIRWLKHNDDKTISIGLQILAPEALTIAVKIADENATKLQRGLLLPNISSAAIPSTVILPAMHFTRNSKLRVFYEDNTAHIALVSPININNHFYQFTYQTLETLDNKPKTEFNKTVEHEPLDDIWDDLLKH